MQNCVYVCFRFRNALSDYKLRITLGDPMSSQKMGSYSEPISDSETCFVFGDTGRKLRIYCFKVLSGSWMLQSTRVRFVHRVLLLLDLSCFSFLLLIWSLLLKECSSKRVCETVSMKKSSAPLYTYNTAW